MSNSQLEFLFIRFYSCMIDYCLIAWFSHFTYHLGAALVGAIVVWNVASLNIFVLSKI